MKRVLILALLALCCLSGCAHNISEQSRSQADMSIPFGSLFRDPDAYKGKFVILGGRIADKTPLEDGVQLEVVQYSLDGMESPNESSVSGGRFLAVVPASLAAPVCRSGMLVSLAGEVVGKKVQQDYGYPVIAVKELHVISSDEGTSIPTWTPNVR